MNIHEFQAKSLLRQYGVPVPEGIAASTVQQAVEAAEQLGGQRWVCKAQVHAGGRGKAGGVEIVQSTADVEAFARRLLGTRLVTFQTDAQGQPVNAVLVERPSAIANELYCSFVIDRSSRKVVVMVSTEGGMDIEEVAEHSPEKILKAFVDPGLGLLAYQCRQLFYGMGLGKALLRPFVSLLTQLYQAFVESDMALLEINPLVITEDEQLICLDAKVNLDPNALYRHPELQELHDPSQEDERENHAQEWALNYIALEGNIGCMVNGAGLAMATMDLIKLNGGQPANFLDVGGGATKERVTEAFKIIISDTQVRGILVNIFGGIVRCDLIADGIIAAVAEIGLEIPVVVRLEGNNADLGAQKLADSGLNITAVQGFAQAAKEIVSIVKQGVEA